MQASVYSAVRWSLLAFTMLQISDVVVTGERALGRTSASNVRLRVSPGASRSIVAVTVVDDVPAVCRRLSWVPHCASGVHSTLPGK